MGLSQAAETPATTICKRGRAGGDCGVRLGKREFAWSAGGVLGRTPRCPPVRPKQPHPGRNPARRSFVRAPDAHALVDAMEVARAWIATDKTRADVMQHHHATGVFVASGGQHAPMRVVHRARNWDIGPRSGTRQRKNSVSGCTGRSAMPHNGDESRGSFQPVGSRSVRYRPAGCDCLAEPLT